MTTPVADETEALLATVHAELSTAGAQLEAKRRTERAELDALLAATAKLEGEGEAFEATSLRLDGELDRAEEVRSQLHFDEARLKERLYAALWSTAALGLLLLAMTPLATSRPWLLYLIPGQLVLAAVGWFDARPRKRRG